jgi:hypothetical protein
VVGGVNFFRQFGQFEYMQLPRVSGGSSGFLMSNSLISSGWILSMTAMSFWNKSD